MAADGHSDRQRGRPSPVDLSEQAISTSTALGVLPRNEARSMLHHRPCRNTETQP